MNVTLMAFGELRDIVGTREKVISLDQGANLGDLMKHLAKEYGPAFYEEVKKVRGLRVLIDGRECQLDRSEASLKEGDTIVLLSPIFGG